MIRDIIEAWTLEVTSSQWPGAGSSTGVISTAICHCPPTLTTRSYLDEIPTRFLITQR